MVDVLREQQPLMPQGDLSGIEELIQRTKGKVFIDFDLQGDPGDVPAPVALAVYRVVQEALTNVVRHAGADRATVTLNIGKQEVAVEIVDDGRRPVPHQAGSGHGIAGMRERVTALGGTFTAGPVAGGGFRVAARIPVRP
jgi:signal transduction histidine kinase